MGKEKKSTSATGGSAATTKPKTAANKLDAVFAMLPASDRVTKLRALAGVKGRLDGPSMLDFEALGYAKSVAVEKLKQLCSSALNRVLVQVETIDQIGLTLLFAAIIKPKSIVDKIAKLFPKGDHLVVPHFRLLRQLGSEHSLGDEPLVLGTARALAVIDKAVLDNLGAYISRERTIRNQIGVAPVTIKRIELRDLEEAVGWLFATDWLANSLKIKKAKTKIKPVGELKDGERLRMAELLSQLPIASVVAGSGQLKTVAQAVRSKTLSYQKSRPDAGLQPPFDMWAEWTRFRLESGKTKYLPIRIDLPTKVTSGPKKRKVGSNAPSPRRGRPVSGPATAHARLRKRQRDKRGVRKSPT